MADICLSCSPLYPQCLEVYSRYLLIWFCFQKQRMFQGRRCYVVTEPICLWKIQLCRQRYQKFHHLFLVLGAWAVNNNTNLGLCRAAMVQLIFWREYLSSEDKQEGVPGSPQVSLDLCTRIGCHVAMAMSPSVEHHILGTWFSRSHEEKEQGRSATIILDSCNHF
jgi:hypothetical protein